MNFLSGFQFASPLFFLLAPAAMFAVIWSQLPRRRPAAVFSSVADLKKLPVTLALRIRRFLPYVYGFGLLLLITALARPQKGKSESKIHTEGIAIELAIDASGSMRAIDFKVNDEPLGRLQAVKHVVEQFVMGGKSSKLSGRKNDLVGLVTFGGFADSKCPLTLDHAALMDIIKSVEIPNPFRGRNPRSITQEEMDAANLELATAIGDGLATALDRLKNTEAKSKIVILLTDGDNNAGVIEPEEAARIAAGLGIKVYTICLGTNGVVPFPEEDMFGNTHTRFRKFPINEPLLKEIASATGGKYFNATNTDALTSVYAEIDQMERSKVEETLFTEYTELYMWWALPGLGLLAAASALSLTRFRALP